MNIFEIDLNLPPFEVRLKEGKNGTEIFDRIRKKYVSLTPEEWVRQHFVEFLIEQKKYPQNKISNETSICYNNLNKRCDTIVYDNDFKPLAIVEYKSPKVKITQKVFDQILVYNQKLNVPFLSVSNGLAHIFCKIDLENSKISFFEQIPDYKDICRV